MPRMTDTQRIKAIGSHLMDAAGRYNAAVSNRGTQSQDAMLTRMNVALEYIESAEDLRRSMKDMGMEYVALCATAAARAEWYTAADTLGVKGGGVRIR